jgi:transposase-like protein
VALEALKGIKPIHEIAADNEIHPVQVSQWKKELQENISEISERKIARSTEANDDQQMIERLERKVGQLVVERDRLAKKVQGAGDRPMRKNFIDRGHSQLSVRCQSRLLGVNRNRLSSKAPRVSENDLAVCREIDRIHLAFPFYASRRMVVELRRKDIEKGRGCARRLMRLMGTVASDPSFGSVTRSLIAAGPFTRVPYRPGAPTHKIPVS